MHEGAAYCRAPYSMEKLIPLPMLSPRITEVRNTIRVKEEPTAASIPRQEKATDNQSVHNIIKLLEQVAQDNRS